MAGETPSMVTSKNPSIEQPSCKAVFQIDYVFQGTNISRIHGEGTDPCQIKEPLTIQLIHGQNAVCMVFAYNQPHEYTRKSAY